MILWIICKHNFFILVKTCVLLYMYIDVLRASTFAQLWSTEGLHDRILLNVSRVGVWGFTWQLPILCSH